MVTSERIVNDGPDAVCFGCGHANDKGLRLSFRRIEGGAEAEFESPKHFEGAPGVVHGGIQATLLDEVLGMTVHLADEEGDADLHIVTVDFQLRYRRPTPVGVALRIRGRLKGREGRSYFVEGEILGPDGEVLTTAEATWRRIEPRPAS